MKEHHKDVTAGLQPYQPASANETQALYKTLTHSRAVNHRNYKKRFIQGANPKRPAHLRFLPPSSNGDDLQPLRTVFHDGLLKDSDGQFWIIKTLNFQARYDLQPRVARNSPQHERLAHLLAQGRANYAEIRPLPKQDHYLTRVVTATTLKSSKWPHTTVPDAYAAILVANIFMRKWDQHLNNFAYAGDLPVSIDHDVIGPSAVFPHTAVGRSSFNLAFLSFKLISLLSSLHPAHDVDVNAKERLKHHFIQQHDREAWWVMRDLIHGLGLGAGLINAEELQPSSLRKSIQTFKSIRSIDQLAEQAGFQDQELEAMIEYLEQTQRTLGRDVGEIWRQLTGDNANLDRLD